MALYYDYKGQYSRLNQSPLFGHHQEWIPNGSIFDKGFSFDRIKSDAIIKFKSVTFQAGWKVVKAEKGELPGVFIYKDPEFRNYISEKYNIQLARNRDIIPGDTEYTIFANERFIGSLVKTIRGRKNWDSVYIEYDGGFKLAIPKKKVVSMEPLKVTKK
jgi:hypothetical protein